MQTVKNERGSVIVFVTLMIVLLMVMVGMGLDTGQMVYTRNMGQSAVDAAALSAVSGLPSRNPGEIAARVDDYNAQNNYTGSSKNVIADTNISYVKYDFGSNTITNYNEPIATANGVRVALEGSNAMKTPMFLTPLMNLFGATTPGVQSVNVSAVSVIASKPAIPIALWGNVCPVTDGTVKSGVKVQMQHPDQKADGNENACWTTFLDCSSGAPDIKAGFEIAGTCSGAAIDGQIAIGTPICQNKGQVNTVMKTAEEFFDANPNSWWLVPVIAGAKNCDVKDPTKITTWAKIYPTHVERTGNPKYIEANVVCSPTLREDLDNSLCHSHRLIREPSKGY